MSNFLHCPNCHYPITQAEREDGYSYCYDQIDSSLMIGRSRQVASQVAPTSHAFGQHHQIQYMPESPHNKRFQSENPQKKVKSLFSLSLPKRLKKLPGQGNPLSPQRPARPLPAQCPPDTTGFSGLKSSISAPFLSPKQQVYRMVQGGPSYSPSLVHEQGANTTKTPSRTSSISSSMLKRDYKHINNWVVNSDSTVAEKDDKRSSSPLNNPLLYSTPPTTISKIALQPSPLHLQHYTPPIPPNNSQFDMPFSSDSPEPAPQMSSPRIFECDSYTSDRSVYSNLTRAQYSPLLDTPPTSPPPLPQRDTSRKTVISEKAELLAHRLRNELSIVEEIKQIGSTCQKASKRKSTAHSQLEGRNSDKIFALSDDAQGSARNIPFPESDRGEDDVLLQAIEEAICKSPKFQAWLLSRQSATDSTAENQASQSILAKISPRSLSAASASSEAMPRSLRKISNPMLSETALQQDSRGAALNTSPTPAQRKSRSSKSPVGLLEMRRKLYELSEDGKSEPGAPDPDSPPASLAKSSRSSASSVKLPLNCRKIEIEFKGRKIPILIHENGKVFESPCTDPSCSQHDGRLAGEIF